MTVLCTFRRPFMGRPVPRQLMRNELLDLTTTVPATAYHRRSYAERYSRFNTKRLIRSWAGEPYDAEDEKDLIVSPCHGAIDTSNDLPMMRTASIGNLLSRDK